MHPFTSFTRELAENIEGSQHHLSPQGNLLELGQIAFAPRTPDVLRLAAHMEASHGMTTL